MEQSKVLAVSELGKPVVHRFDDREDSVTTITKKIADTFLFQFPGRFARPVDQLDVKRDKSVPSIAHQEYHMGPRQLPCRHKIFTANALPERCFHSLCRETEAELDARHIGLMRT